MLPWSADSLNDKINKVDSKVHDLDELLEAYHDKIAEYLIENETRIIEHESKPHMYFDRISPYNRKRTKR